MYPSEHRFKYSLFYGVSGFREVLYDNERGKGDHRHYGDHEEGYEFAGIESLIADFLSMFANYENASMSKNLQIHIGDSLEDIGARTIDAWYRMERGEEVQERHVGFENWETMVRVLTPKRLELLRYLHQHPAKNIRSLAPAVGRDYRRVHEDVEALEGAGLLNRDKEGLRADYDAFDVQMQIVL